MTQFDLDTPINPNTKSGSVLASDLSAWRDALHSAHKGTVRPTYAVAGTVWTLDSGTPWIVYMFDGADDIAIGTINATTNIFIPGASAMEVFDNIKQQATTGSAGALALATQAEVNTGTDNLKAVTPATLAGARLQLQTALDISTSAATYDFTSIPSWAVRITITLVNMGVSAQSVPYIQIGTSGGLEITGYSGVATTIAGGSVGGFTYTGANGIGYRLVRSTGNWFTSSIYQGEVVLNLADRATNTWICTSQGASWPGGNIYLHPSAGKKSLTGALDRIRLTTQGGTALFNKAGGTFNISWE